MDKVAMLPDADRRDLFEATASVRGVHPAIIEKDFWVCWVLKKIFASKMLKGNLVFKGGTSLTKVFNLIQRFSEDIDLVLNWNLLGYGQGGQDPWAVHASKSQQDRFTQEFNDRAASYIKEVLYPHLVEVFAVIPSVRPTVSVTEDQVIDIRYPAAFSLQILRPEVKLEIGPLAAWMPSDRYVIQPYAAEVYREIFEDPICPVVALKPERTFWEKATILHQQAHRTTPMPRGYSRHYYDLHQLAASPIRDVALGNLHLLAEVVKFKQRFYRCPWARYEEATPGTFRLLPTEVGAGELERDYRQIRDMIYALPPDWTDILASLGQLEEQVNRLDKR